MNTKNTKIFILFSFFICQLGVLNLAQAEPATREQFERAKAEHFIKYSDILIERIAGKLGLKKEHVRDALTITNDENGLILNGHVRVQNSICQLEGKVELMDKSLRAVCFDEQYNLRIVL